MMTTRLLLLFFFVKFIDAGINTAAGRLSNERDRFIPTTKRHTYTIDIGFRATYIHATLHNGLNRWFLGS